MYGLDGIDQDDRRYDEPDPDVMRDRRQEQQWEADTLERHLAGGLAPDAEVEERAAQLGESLDGPDYRCAPMWELGNQQEDSRG